MKRVVIEMVFDDAYNIIEDSQTAFHEFFKDNQDYIDNNIAVTTDVPYTKETGFAGDESRLTVDFTTLKCNKALVPTTVIDAVIDQFMTVPGIKGTIFDDSNDE